MSKRLFIGIGFSEQLSRQVDLWMKKVRKTADQKDISAKWTPSDNLHVTLHFLGNTPESQIPVLEKCLHDVAARHAPFSLKIRNVGGFPELERARVLWLGVQRSQALLNLQSDVENEIKIQTSPSDEQRIDSGSESYVPPAGTEDQAPMEREYASHLTFGRLRSAKSCRDLLSPFSHADFGRQEVTEILLYNSIQAGAFPVYQKLARFPLVGVKAIAPDTEEASKLE